MEAYRGPAKLLWWLNRSTAASSDVLASVDATPDGWRVVATVSSEEEYDVLEFLPSPYELVFPDGSAFLAEISPTGAEGEFSVVEWTEDSEQREGVRLLDLGGGTADASGVIAATWSDPPPR